MDRINIDCHDTDSLAAEDHARFNLNGEGGEIFKKGAMIRCY